MYNLIPMKAVIGAVVIMTMIIASYYAGIQYQKLQYERARLDAIERAAEIEDEVDNLDDTGLLGGILQPD